MGGEGVLLFQGATAVLPACSGRTGDGDLQAAGVGHQRLTAIDGPAVRRGQEPGQRFELDHRKEVEVAAGRVGQVVGTPAQELRQSSGGVVDGRHGGMLCQRRSARSAVGMLATPPGQNGTMPRAIWSGSISFGLVNVPVKLVTATSPKDVRFHQLHDADGGRINQKRVCSLDGEEVDYSEIVKGYELSGASTS